MTASPTLSILDRPAQATPARPITGGGRAQEPQLKREVSARARLHTPQFKRAVLKRTRLLAQLARERDRRVALVCAPAGFGKTILAAQLSAEDPRPSGWLHLDHADNDPVVLLNDLVEVLERLEPVASGLARELESPFPVIGDAILALLERDLVSRDPFVLVLDELEVLSSAVRWRWWPFSSARSRMAHSSCSRVAASPSSRSRECAPPVSFSTWAGAS